MPGHSGLRPRVSLFFIQLFLIRDETNKEHEVSSLSHIKRADA